MKKIIFSLLILTTFASCNSKNSKDSNTDSTKSTGNSDYIITKNGIGNLKIGMSVDEAEKLLGQKISLKHAQEEDIWTDTANAKYKDIEVTLYFQPRYTENENDARIMEIFGLATNSPLCKTAAGIKIGDSKTAVLAAYDESPINMGPEFEQVNDTTWLPNFSKFYINVRDTSFDKDLIFKLNNKKVSSIEASIVLGD